MTRGALWGYPGATGTAASRRDAPDAARASIAGWSKVPPDSFEVDTVMLAAEPASSLCRLLEGAGVRFWVMGGWGVDALLGRQTRPHKDLDVLVLLDDLSTLDRVLRDHGFSQTLVWEESRSIEQHDGTRSASAFVAADAAGRELDVHLISLDQGGGIIQHYDNPWPFPDSIDAIGTIAGVAIPCVSVATQEAMHVGYPLPEAQNRDLKLLADSADVRIS
jgi:lincosamide nucleotidyltransferase A/C/D/E